MSSFPVVAGGSLIFLLLLRLGIFSLLGGRLHLLSPKKISFWQGSCGAVLCLACNNIFPARMGELSKIVYLRIASRSNYGALRGMDVLCLFILAVLFGAQYLSVGAALLCSGILLIGGTVILCYVVPERKFQEKLWNRFPRLRKLIKDFYSALRAMSFRTLGKGLLLPATIWAGNFCHAWVLANCLLPVSLSLQQTGIFCVALFGSSAFFLIPGGYGLMEGTVTALLVMFGCDKVQAFTIALWARVYYTLPPLIVSVGLCMVARSSFVSQVFYHFRQTIIRGE